MHMDFVHGYQPVESSNRETHMLVVLIMHLFRVKVPESASDTFNKDPHNSSRHLGDSKFSQDL